MTIAKQTKGSILMAREKHLAMLRDAGLLAAQIDLGRALCGLYREVVDGGTPGINWDRARRMQRDSGLLVSIVEAAVAPPVERDFVVLAAMPLQDASVTAYRALAVYEAFEDGRLAGVTSAARAAVIAGLEGAG